MNDFNDIKCFLLDMDGTIYLGESLIGGARDFLRNLDEQGKKTIFLTNNSSKNKYSYQEKLSSLGIDVDPNDIFTSGEATTIYLNSKKPGAKLFLLGTPLLEDEFRMAGFELVSQGNPDYVVLGFDTTLTYNKLWHACDYIRAGINYLATHPDYNCPLGEGKYMPDAGAMIKFFEASTGANPVVIGKPNHYIVDSVCEKYKIEKESMAMVGDRLYTDIKLGINAGITTVLVLSGETTQQQYDASDIEASHVFPSIKELGQALKKRC